MNVLYWVMCSQHAHFNRRCDMFNDIMDRDITSVAVRSAVLSADTDNCELPNVTSVFISTIAQSMQGYRFKYCYIHEVVHSVVCPVTRGSPRLIRNRLQTYADVCYKSRVRLDDDALTIDLNTYKG